MTTDLMPHPMDLSASALATAIRAGDLTPADAARTALDRADDRNPGLNAITRLNPRVMQEAGSVALRLAAGEDLPLAGVPVLIKDNIWVGGMGITQGSRLFEQFVAPEDAIAVRMLRRAGAVILGIGTCAEFACKGSTNTPLYGMTRNPVDPALTPGGSSGGCVAAVAARICPLALGTDAGGSSRRPPAHVGILGFKPTPDVIPYGPGFDEPVWGISSLCPLARSMEDILLMTRVLAPLLPDAAGEPLRLAYSPDFGTGQALEPEVARNFNAAIGALSDAGVALTEAAPDWQGTTGADPLPLQFAGLAALFGDRWRAEPALFDPDLGAQIEAGLALSGTEVAEAHFSAHRLTEALRVFFRSFDAILTPTTPCPAWPVELSAPATIVGKPCAGRDHAAFTPQANHAGCPAISLPSGTTPDGLPLGLQIVAPRGQDARLLALAAKVAPLIGGTDPGMV
ncbi:amidase [Litorisediminicola beolgyonensis]|uniref:Amidase n=1 Tax=Litorisediminicola beolgyonensis TaxID=1173614 RepID=A0ABW3ZLQ8_9RHOB